MRLHLDVLGLLHRVWGALAAATGLSLFILAGGTWLPLGAIDPLRAGRGGGLWLLVGSGALLAAGGAVMWLTGTALRRRRKGGRFAALVLAVPNLILVPFGTALGIYTYWALLNDDARVAFGRPARGAVAQATRE